MQTNSYLGEIQQRVQARFAGTRFAWFGTVICAPVTWILLLTMLSVVCYSPVYLDVNGRTPYRTSPDTNSYTIYWYNILKGETDLIRTPVYPYFLKIIYNITGCEAVLVETTRDTNHPVYGTVYGDTNYVRFDTIIQGRDTCFYIVFCQRVLYLLSLIPFYFACRLILRNPAVCFLSVLFVAVSFMQYQSWILTEPLAISGSMVFFAWMIFYLKKPTVWSAFALPLFVFVLLMERPVFIYLAILLFGFFALRLIISPDRKQSLAGLGSLLLVGLLCHGYSLLNLRNHGVYTISTVSVSNRFVTLLKSGMYQKSCDAEIVNYINESPLKDSGAGYALSDDFTWRFGHQRRIQFVNDVIKANKVQYVTTNIKNMYWEMDFCGFRPHYILGVLDFLLTVILWCRLKQFPWIRLGTWGLVFGLFVVIYQVGWDGHVRLMLPAMPVLYLMYVKYVDIVVHAGERSKSEIHSYLKETL